MPWVRLCEVIAPYCPKAKAGNGHPPIGLERMLRIHCIQRWFNRADLACKEARYGSASLRRFVGIDPRREHAPDTTTLLMFFRLLNDHKSCIHARAEHVFGVVKRLWGNGQGTLPRAGPEPHARICGLALANNYLGRQRLTTQLRP